MPTVREFLTKYNEARGYTTDDESLVETLLEAGHIVHREGRDQHRWYILETAVAELDGVLIKFQNYVITGDSSASDMGLKYDLDSAKIVTGKERQVTEVYYT